MSHGTNRDRLIFGNRESSSPIIHYITFRQNLFTEEDNASIRTRTNFNKNAAFPFETANGTSKKTEEMRKYILPELQLLSSVNLGESDTNVISDFNLPKLSWIAWKLC